MNRPRSLYSLAGVLQDTVRKLDLEEPVIEARAVALWAEIVGEQTARSSRAERLIGGVLHVVAYSDAWHQELQFMRPTLVRRFTERLGRSVVTNVRITVDRSERPDAVEPEGGTATVRSIQLSAEELAHIEAAAACADPELSQSIRRALVREAQLRNWRLRHGGRPCSRCGVPFRGDTAVCPACQTDGRAV